MNEHDIKAKEEELKAKEEERSASSKLSDLKVDADYDFEMWRQRLERRRRLVVVLIVVPSILGISILNLPFDVWKSAFGITADVTGTRLVGISLLALSFFIILMLYLQTGFRSFRRVEIRTDFADEIERVKSKLADAKEQSRLAENIIKSTSTIASVATPSPPTRLDKIQAIDERFSSASRRLTNEMTALSFRGNLNLALGIVTTIVGLGLLGYFVISSKTDTPQLNAFATAFIPRISLVICIEVFAYFFLRLYKSNLAEIKYFQNELTNLELKYLAFRTALETENEKAVAAVIELMAATERNHILKAGETTVQLEQLKNEKELTIEVTKRVSEAVTAALKK